MNLLDRNQLPESFMSHLKAKQNATLIGIRAENIDVSSEPIAGALQAQVLVVEPLGSHNLLTVQAHGQTLKVNTRPETQFHPNDNIWLQFAPSKLCWLG
jgi:multiple sugar transport system ATP-binding protein